MVKTPEENEDVKVEKSADKASASVVNDKGGHVRTYTLEVHGKDYEKLAEEYAKKVKGKVL